MILIVSLTVFLYFPMLWSGIRTLNNRVSGLWVGLGLLCAGVALSVVGLLGIAYDPGTFGDAAVRMPLFTLLTILFLIGLALHIVAMISRLAGGSRNRPQKGSDRRPASR